VALSRSIGYSATEIWETALGQLLLRVTRQNYETWLRSTVGLRFDGTTMVVGAANELAADWLSSRMRTVITQALAAVAGPGLQVRFETMEAPAASREPEPLQPSFLSSPPPPLNPRFSFSTYLASDFNRLPVSAAHDLLSEEPSFSPLFVTGESGSGKTHLLHAIAHEAIAARRKVILVGAEQFLSEFTTSIRNRGGAAFRARYRELELLLIDDVQILLGKKATLAEFYQTVAGLQDEGRLVAVAGDLSAMNGDAARFQSELHWGLVAPIQSPSIEERVAFVRAKAELQRVVLPAEVQHYIALRVRSNLRELEGAVNRVAALARISHEAITIDFTAKALRPVGSPTTRKKPPAQPTSLLEAVCRHLSLSPDQISSQKRDRALTYARHIAMYLLRNDAGLTYAAIAELLQKRDHSTVVHACKQIHQEMTNSPSLRADIDAIRSSLDSSNTAA
jgi:chromosomal replication initiator protein